MDVCSPSLCGERDAVKGTVLYRESINVGGVGRRQAAPAFVGATPVGFRVRCDYLVRTNWKASTYEARTGVKLQNVGASASKRSTGGGPGAC